MIRYDVDFAELEQAIGAAHPTWRTRAAAAVTRMRAAKPRSFDASGPSWSEIKAFYVALQHSKCAYCEKQLEREDFGLIEHDVEHYRPKRKVEHWPRPEYAFQVADGNPRGYCMLAYDLRNYCTACKTCNSARKRSYFPITGKPGRADARDIIKLNQREQPLIPYPLGDIDDDPESLITFVGFVPVPRRRGGQRRRRAQVTIDLFALDQRAELTRGRSAMIRVLWLAIRAALYDTEQSERTDARAQISSLLSGHEPHTACARAFLRLFEADPAAAAAVYREACTHLASSS